MLSSRVSDGEVKRYQRKIERLRDPAGLEPRSGQGVTIVLSDAPEDVINSTTGNVNPLLVHQQDIQAVVNALWKGGATAVTIQGQRVVSTTGIKCEGNSVQLQGVPYPQPYVIQAVGDQGALLAAVDGDSYLDAYRDDADRPGHLGRLGPRARGRRHRARRTTACSTSTTRPRCPARAS